VKAASTVRAYDPDERFAHQDDDGNPVIDATPGKKTSADAQRHVRRFGTASMLSAQRRAARDKINDARVNATLLMTCGSQQLCAGLVVTLQGWHKLDGQYLIVRASHTMTRTEGYTTEIEIKKVQYDKPIPKKR
jgi:phage protein D